MPEPTIHCKRIYDEPAAADGRRVLVDRLWPRGVRKELARLHLWAKDAAPSADLRRWLHDDPTRWPDFKRRYLRELRSEPARTEPLRTMLRKGEPITLLYASRDAQRNHALVLRDFLLRESAD